MRQTVSISAVLTNNGGSKGTYTVELKINDWGVTDSQTVQLGTQESRTMSFSVIPHMAGDYIVELNGLVDYFIVVH